MSVRPSPAQIGIAFPGTFMLDCQGRVTSRHFEDYYIERSTVSSIMMRLGGKAAAVAGSKISTGQFDITTSIRAMQLSRPGTGSRWPSMSGLTPACTFMRRVHRAIE